MGDSAVVVGVKQHVGPVFAFAVAALAVPVLGHDEAGEDPLEFIERTIAVILLLVVGIETCNVVGLKIVRPRFDEVFVAYRERPRYPQPLPAHLDHVILVRRRGAERNCRHQVRPRVFARHLEIGLVWVRRQ